MLLGTHTWLTPPDKLNKLEKNTSEMLEIVAWTPSRFLARSRGETGRSCGEKKTEK